MKPLRNLKYVVFALIALGIIGILGFHFLEGWPLFDGFYMVLTTFTTIGYTELHPLSQAGRAFNSFLIFTGVGLVFLAIGLLTQALIEFEYEQLFGRRKMQREIGSLTDHYIICGAGRVGRAVARELARKPAPFVVIENKPEKAQRFASEFLTIVGDATHEATLREAHIDRAIGLVAATTTDATNVYIVLTARGLNPKLKILARASEDEAERHLLTAGADSVVSPYTFAGHRIAHSFLRPNVLDLIDVAMVQQGELGLEIEEILITPDSPMAGKTIATSKLRQDLGLIVLGIKRGTAPIRYNPKSEDLIEANDRIIVMGEPSGLRRLEEIAAARA
jgi:voltage-gated potassium channel